MNLDSHLNELRSKHQSLSRRIEEEERRPAGNDLEISSLKRKKLHIKEEIARISSQN